MGTMTEGTHNRETRRNDPDRRRRIVEACLDVIAEKGVADTSHRAVAAVAGVPLGSMTYYFDGMSDLLHQAFDLFARRDAAAFASHMDRAANPDEALEVIARRIEVGLLATQGDLNINLEFYAIAARDPAYRNILAWWTEESHRQIERFFDPRTAALIDVMVEGATLHRTLAGVLRDPASIRDGLRRVAYGVGMANAPA